jgi:hypothetical protein
MQSQLRRRSGAPQNFRVRVTNTCAETLLAN